MKPNPQKGIAILIAVVAVSAMLLIALAISDISFKEQIITFFGRDSKTAFYAANSGIECALFHDFGGGTDGSFQFPTSTQSSSIGTLHCAEQDLQTHVNANASNATTYFYFNVDDDPKSCALVQIRKEVVGSVVQTRVESRGYNNTCEEDRDPSDPRLSTDNPRNLERALLMTY